MTHPTSNDPTGRVLALLPEAVPNLPGDSANAPLIRRLEALLLASMAVSDALRGNADPLGHAHATELANLAHATAQRITDRVHGIELAAHIAPRLPEGWSLLRFSDAAMEKCG